jgi:hypothetical protein
MAKFGKKETHIPDSCLQTAQSIESLKETGDFSQHCASQGNTEIYRHGV